MNGPQARNHGNPAQGSCWSGEPVPAQAELGRGTHIRYVVLDSSSGAVRPGHPPAKKAALTPRSRCVCLDKAFVLIEGHLSQNCYQDQ